MFGSYNVKSFFYYLAFEKKFAVENHYQFIVLKANIKC